MKVVFVADLQNQSASGHQRFWALQQCGAKVYTVDKRKHSPYAGRLSGALAKTVRQPRLLWNGRSLANDIINVCTKVRPDIVWFEWPREFTPSLFQSLQKMHHRPFLISFQDDNPWAFRYSDKWIWRSYFKIVPQFDLHLVKRPQDIDNLTSLGAKKCLLWKHGIYSPLFYPSSTEKIYPVTFVGTCMDNRVELIRYLLEQGIPVHVFGNMWSKRSDLPKRFPHNFHPAVEGEAYANVIRQSQICLGLVSHSNQDEWTMRTYEVPGCAGLLLAERTATHEALFIEDKEAVFFSSPQECASKVSVLLPNPSRCIQIGAAAYNKFMAENRTIEASMKALFHQLPLSLKTKHKIPDLDY